MGPSIHLYQVSTGTLTSHLDWVDLESKNFNLDSLSENEADLLSLHLPSGPPNLAEREFELVTLEFYRSGVFETNECVHFSAVSEGWTRLREV